MRRPTTLAEVAAWSTDRRSFALHLADFLDHFKLTPDPTLLTPEPPRLAAAFPEGAVCDAYAAAVAVTLAREIAACPPRWALAGDRRLREPWFAHPGAALRSTLLWESPAPFRERNLFVSENALDRA